MIFGTMFSPAEKKQGKQCICSKVIWVTLPFGISETFLVSSDERTFY